MRSAPLMSFFSFVVFCIYFMIFSFQNILDTFFMGSFPRKNTLFFCSIKQNLFFLLSFDGGIFCFFFSFFRFQISLLIVKTLKYIQTTEHCTLYFGIYYHRIICYGIVYCLLSMFILFPLFFHLFFEKFLSVYLCLLKC